jgi:hypothetical protein
MEQTLEQVLEALDARANTICELAWELGVSRREAEECLEECVRRGWVVKPMPAATVPMPWGWAPYLVLSSKGEQALAEMGAGQ